MPHKLCSALALLGQVFLPKSTKYFKITNVSFGGPSTTDQLQLQLQIELELEFSPRDDKVLANA